MLLETAWRGDFTKNDFGTYKRVFDTNTKKSKKVPILKGYEYYVEDPCGDYEFILNKDIKLKKMESKSSKDTQDAYGVLAPLYREIRDEYWNKDLYNHNPRIFYLDIETRSGVNSSGFPVPENSAEEVTLIQIYDNYTEKMYILGSRDWKHQSDYNFDYDLEYKNCIDEIGLFKEFFRLFKELDPLIVYAWNGGGFDYPYLINRSKKLFGNADGMSNYGSVKLTEKTSETGKLVYKVSSDGHHFLDLLDVYKTFVYKARSSYSLDNIAFVELKERKVPHTEYAAFDDFYTGKYVIPTNPTEHQKNSKIYNHAIKYGVDDEVRELSYSEFVYYGAKDTYLIKRIDDKLKFTSLLTMIADKMGVVISDTMSTVKPWSNYLGNRAMVNKKVMPPNKQKDASPNIVGGFVRDPQVGKHKWVLSCDVNSMYPLLGMVGFNNSPETFVSKSDLPPDLRSIILTYFNNQNEAERLYMDESIWNHTTELLKKYNYSLGINGAIFDKSELGMIPELVQEIYNTRKDYKKTMFKYETRALLIEDILNERNSK